MTILALSRAKDKKGNPRERYLFISDGGEKYDFSYFCYGKWSKFAKKKLPFLWGEQNWKVFLEEKFSNCVIFDISDQKNLQEIINF